MTRVTVLAGGVGGARFTRGLLQQLAAEDARVAPKSPFGSADGELVGNSASGTPARSP